MNRLRKQVFISCVFSAIILFIAGIIMLKYVEDVLAGKVENKGIFGKMINAENYAKLDKPINILLTGSDDVSFQTDTIMVINYNPKNAKISLLSIPRDTMVRYNNSMVMINSIYASSGKGERGCKNLARTIDNLLQIHIDKYVFIGTEVFRDVVDEFGGIDYNVPCAMRYIDAKQGLNINLNKGQQHLNGRQAEGLIRFRQANVNYYKNKEEFREAFKLFNYNPDVNRIKTQQNFIREFIKQNASVKVVNKIDNVITLIIRKITTNFELKTIIQESQAITKFNKEKITNFTMGTIPYSRNKDRLEYNNEIWQNLENGQVKRYSPDEILIKYFYSEKNDEQDEDLGKSQIVNSTAKNSLKSIPTVNPSNRRNNISNTYKPNKNNVNNSPQSNNNYNNNLNNNYNNNNSNNNNNNYNNNNSNINNNSNNSNHIVTRPPIATATPEAQTWRTPTNLSTPRPNNNDEDSIPESVD